MAKSLAVSELTEMRNVQTVLVPPRPLSFEEFVSMFGEDDEVELIDGVVVRKMAAGKEHEDLFGWLSFLLHGYVDAKGLGVVYGSRTPVVITGYRARLPDILFVRKGRESIVQERGIYGVPDLVIEILSPREKQANIVALESDYRSIGVSEIWLVDQKRKRVKVLRKRDGDYKEQVISKGILRSEAVEGFWVRVEWLFSKRLPQRLETLTKLLGQGR